MQIIPCVCEMLRFQLEIIDRVLNFFTPTIYRSLIEHTLQAV